MSKDFRIIFMGTPEFAVASLKALIDAGFNVVAVVTAPDKPAGRGQKIQESDVKKFTNEVNETRIQKIELLTPPKLKDIAFIEQLRYFNADLFVVVAFRMLPEEVWSIPKSGTINLHASLLPKYRGAAPINWVIINGAKETGVTTFFIEKEIDTGKIINHKRVRFTDDDDAGSLHDKLMFVGADLLVKTVSDIISGEYTEVPQIKSAPKITKETRKIDWNNDVDKVYNLIRGLSPYPTACTLLQNQQSGETISVKIFKTEKEKFPLKKKKIQDFLPGSIESDEKSYLKVAVMGGFLNIKIMQLEGKKRLGIEEFLRGFKNIRSYRFV